jgi:hypothetical protein
MSCGVSRQGGPGIGGGIAAGRHHAITSGGATSPRPVQECLSCGKAVTTTLVVESGRLYCSWDCAASIEPMIPGRYLG